MLCPLIKTGLSIWRQLVPWLAGQRDLWSKQWGKSRRSNGDVKNAEAEATLGSRSHVKELLRLPRTRRGMEAMEGVSRSNRLGSGGWNLGCPHLQYPCASSPQISACNMFLNTAMEGSVIQPDPKDFVSWFLLRVYLLLFLVCFYICTIVLIRYACTPASQT